MVRIFIFCLFYISLSDFSGGMCPAVCECNDGKLFCINSGLTNLLQIRSSKHLSLAGSFVNCIRPSGFWLYTNISVLDFESESTEEINYGSFYDLNNLKELYLGCNHISALNCPLLSELNIVNMSLLNDALHGTLPALKQLEKLDLSGKVLTPAPEPTTLKSLLILLSEDSRIRSLTKEAFKGMWRLQRLNLSGNKLSSFPKGIFSSLLSLSQLILDHNLLSKIKDSDFEDLVNLKVLSLSHNKLSLINPSSFTKLFKLEVLNVDGNRIFKIQKFTFQYCPNLQEINLSNNVISAVDELAFSGLSRLKMLRLNNNSLFYLNPQVFGPSPLLQSLDLRGNVWKCDCRLLSLKSWLESGRDRLVTVRCSHPETLKGQYLGAISSSVIRSADSQCSRAQTRVQSKPTHADNSSRVTRQSHHDGDRYHTQRRVGRTVPQHTVKLERKRNASRRQYQIQPGGVVWTPPNKIPVTLAARSPNLTRQTGQEENTASDACFYNQLVILNVSAVTVTSSSALIKWSLVKKDLQNVYFRVMYDHFNPHTRFSRFVNVKQGTEFYLYDLRPSTPYLVCVESVVDEKVCQVASRDLCIGIITKPEETSSPDPQTIILYFSGINTLAILAVLALFVHMGRIWRRSMKADALSLLYSRGKSSSCAMCAGIALSDRNSGVNTTSSNTGTYQQNDAIDAIDIPGH